MNLRFLGKGSAFYPVYGNTGAYMLYGKELYLLDCGETAFERLYELVGFDEIERVELHYNQWELDHRWSYGLWVWVIKKDGKTKKVYYKGYRTAKLALPSDMKAALEEKGLRVVMVDGQKK